MESVTELSNEQLEIQLLLEAIYRKYGYDFREYSLAHTKRRFNVTEMFRDPWFYRRVREVIIPHLQTYPFVKVWHAGCSAGQEVYSMGILLEEEGMKDRAQVYATDFNEAILEKAKQGIYPMDLIRQYTANYQAAGGHPLEDWPPLQRYYSDLRIHFVSLFCWFSISVPLLRVTLPPILIARAICRSMRQKTSSQSKTATCTSHHPITI